MMRSSPCRSSHRDRFAAPVAAGRDRVSRCAGGPLVRADQRAARPADRQQPQRPACSGPGGGAGNQPDPAGDHRRPELVGDRLARDAPAARRSLCRADLPLLRTVRLHPPGRRLGEPDLPDRPAGRDRGRPGAAPGLARQDPHLHGAHRAGAVHGRIWRLRPDPGRPARALLRHGQLRLRLDRHCQLRLGLCEHLPALPRPIGLDRADRGPDCRAAAGRSRRRLGACSRDARSWAPPRRPPCCRLPGAGARHRSRRTGKPSSPPIACRTGFATPSSGSGRIGGRNACPNMATGTAARCISRAIPFTTIMSAPTAIPAASGSWS